MTPGVRASTLAGMLLILAAGVCATAGAASPAPTIPAAEVPSELAAALQALPDRERGERLFATCAACHGVDGMGQPDGAAPAIAGQYRVVLLRQLVDYRVGRRWDLRMEHVMQLRRLETVQDIADVAAFAAALPATGRVTIGNGRHLGVGAASYLRHCADCHGATGQGSAEAAVARLAGQHHPYLLRQFFDVLEGRRPPLSASHGRSMADMDQARAEGIADYLSRMQPRAPDASPASPPGGAR